VKYFLVLQFWLLAVALMPPPCHMTNEPCQKAEVFRARGVKAWSLTSGPSHFFYEAGLAIDADGAYRAYHPDDTPGLDSLNHAGHPANWWALVTDNGKRTGKPVIQMKSDPAPGFYVSTTALYDEKNPNPRDPRRYVDAESIPYVVLHPEALKHARLGDFAVVMNMRNGKVSVAIVADESASNLPVGEGSIALARALGVNANARTGGQDESVVYLIFANSGNGRPRELKEIVTNANQLLALWGGLDRLNACVTQSALR
jgi:hypothetical protein